MGTPIWSLAKKPCYIFVTYCEKSFAKCFKPVECKKKFFSKQGVFRRSQAILEGEKKYLRIINALILCYVAARKDGEATEMPSFMRFPFLTPFFGVLRSKTVEFSVHRLTISGFHGRALLLLLVYAQDLGNGRKETQG